ncbi:MAG TPA: glycoside hydrolase family 3 C-terminal domain-containing protein, partial [Tichowtungia sp.]|nr:glycoside hydrolase family 3 C-terminal domain-containing protein [Tichowtungia sp.]
AEKGMEVIYKNSDGDFTPVMSSNLRPPPGMDGDIGLWGEYFQGTELRGSPSASRLDQRIAFNWPKPIGNIDPLIPQPRFSVRWTGQLVPDRTGEFKLAVDSDDGVRVWLDNKLIIEDWHARAVKRNESKPIMLTAGEAYDLRVEYFDAGGDAIVRLLWELPEVEEKKYDPETTMVVYVGGYGLEDADEFFDLMDLELKNEELEEIQEFYSEYTNTVVVLNGGTIVPCDWLYENVPAVLHAWYLGQEGGDALADLLFGKVSPSGHLPVTYYKSKNDLPPIKDYDLSKGRTYMYFDKPVTYPFGYGLSYTEFGYGELSVNVESASADAPSVTVSIPVKNTGDMEADDVVQLYVRDVKRNPKAYNPIKQLRGFQRLSLRPGETKVAEFELNRSAFAYWDVDKDQYVVEPGEFEIQIGASSADIRARKTIGISR